MKIPLKLPSLKVPSVAERKKIAVVAAGVLLLGFVIWRVIAAFTFRYAGTVEAQEVDVPARVSSVVASVDVAEGDTVAKGAVLLRLACEDVRLAADLAESNFRRAQALLRGGSMPQAEYDRLKYVREDAALRRGWCTLRAPLAGVVLVIYPDPGEMVVPGSKVATVADLSEVWAFVYVPQPMLARLKPGMKVRGRLPEMWGKRFDGRVASIRERAEFTPRNVQTREERTRLVYGVKLSFPNPDGILKPGMTIEARLP